MSTLQAMLAELSNESTAVVQQPELDVEGLLQYSIEAVQLEAERAIALMTSLDQGFQKHFGGEVTEQSFEAYAVDVERALLTAGLQIPTVVIAPSFEASTGVAVVDQKAAVSEKKDNVLVRGVKAVWEALKKFKDWFLALFKKKADDVEKEAAEVKEAADESKAALAKLKALPAPKVAELKKKKFLGPVPESAGDDPIGYMKGEVARAKEMMAILAKPDFSDADIATLNKLSDLNLKAIKGKVELKEFDLDEVEKLVNELGNIGLSSDVMGEFRKQQRNIDARVTAVMATAKAMESGGATTESLAKLKAEEAHLREASKAMLGLIASTSKVYAWQKSIFKKFSKEIIAYAEAQA